MTLPVCFCLLLLVTGVEQLQSAPCAAVQRSSGRCEGHRLVSSPARPAGLRRGNGGPLPSLLEHSDRTGVTEYRHRLTGLQPGLVQTCQRAGKTSTYTQSNQMLFPVLTFTLMSTRSAHTATPRTRSWCGNTHHSPRWPSSQDIHTECSTW